MEQIAQRGGPVDSSVVPPVDPLQESGRKLDATFWES